MSAPTLITFPYPPDGGFDFVESLKYSTDVLPAHNLTEQRIAQRGIPGGNIEFAVAQSDPATAAAVMLAGAGAAMGA